PDACYATYFSSLHARRPTPPPFPTRRSSDLVTRPACGVGPHFAGQRCEVHPPPQRPERATMGHGTHASQRPPNGVGARTMIPIIDRKRKRLNSSHRTISYAVFCLKKKNDNYK